MLWCAISMLTLGLSMVRDALTVRSIEPEYVAYSEFMTSVEANELYAVYEAQSGVRILFQYKTDVAEEYLDKDPAKVSAMSLAKDKWYYTNYAKYDDFNKDMLLNDVPVVAGQFNYAVISCVSMIVSSVSLLFLCLLIYVLTQSVGGGIRFGEEKFEVTTRSDYTFDDVIGHDEVIEDIKSYVSLLSRAPSLKQHGIKPPKGILFTGAPGTGKTLMAKAMAGEAKVPFIYLNTSNVIEMFVGVGAKTIRSCFKKARQLAPCVVFLDEIDAIGRKRGESRGSSEDNQTILALLQELDGFKSTEGVLVIAATNCPNALDPAIKRAGRFDREIVINPPRNRKVRLELLEHYTAGFALGKSVNLNDIAAQLSGMTGADIATICNEAAIVAVMRNPESDSVLIEADDFTCAIDKLILKGNRLADDTKVNKQDRNIVAYHEAGHAVCSYLLNEPISRISIQGTTSGVGGFVMPEDKDTQFQTRSFLEHKVMIAYAGRCSECIKFGESAATTGAVNDIEQATSILSSMVLTCGFDSTLGMLDYSTLIESRLADAQVINDKLVNLSVELQDRTMELLKSNYNLVEKLVDALLEQETLMGTEVQDLLTSGNK